MLASGASACAGGVRFSVSRVVGRKAAQGVGRASGGDRETAAGGVDDDVIGGISGARRDAFEARAFEIGWIGEGRVGEAGDMRAARPHLLDASARETDQAAPRHARDADVGRSQRRGEVHHRHVLHHRAPGLDGADVRAGAADLEQDPVGYAVVEDGARQRGGGTADDGVDGSLAQSLQIDGAAVAADHEQGDAGQGALQCSLHVLGGPEHGGQDGGVDGGGARAHLQAVDAGELRAGGGGQAGLAQQLGRAALEGGVVDGERLAHGCHLDAVGPPGRGQGPHPRVEVRCVGGNEGPAQLERPAAGQA